MKTDGKSVGPPVAWYIVQRSGEKLNPQHGTPGDYSIEHCARDGHRIVLLYTHPAQTGAALEAPDLEARAALEFLRSYRATLPSNIQKAGIGAAIAVLAEALDAITSDPK